MRTFFLEIQKEGGKEVPVSRKQLIYMKNIMSNSLNLSGKTGEQYQPQREAEKEDSGRNVRDSC